MGRLVRVELREGDWASKGGASLFGDEISEGQGCCAAYVGLVLRTLCRLIACRLRTPLQLTHPNGSVVDGSVDESVGAHSSLATSFRGIEAQYLGWNH